MIVSRSRESWTERRHRERDSQKERGSQKERNFFFGLVREYFIHI